MFEWHLNYPAQVASTQPAERVLRGSVPQAAFSDGSMKAATSVATGDASAVLHRTPNMLDISRAHDRAKAFRLTDSWRTCQGRSDPRRSSKATHTSYQTE
jgi:hypothetical protein